MNEAKEDCEHQDFLMWTAFEALSHIYNVPEYEEFCRKIDEVFNGEA